MPPGSDDSPRDCHGFLVTLLIAVAFGALAMLYSVVLYHFQIQLEHGIHRDFWYQPSDIWMMIDGGRFVWHGALGYVYQGVGQSYALPLSYILSAPVAALVDHFHLVEGIVPLARPSAWPIAGCFLLLFNVFLLDAIRRTAWDLGIRRRLWHLQIIAVLVVCVPTFQYGHFEDVLALTFLLHAIRYVMLRRPLAACLLLSLGISCKQWVVLAVPLAIVLSPRGRRLTALLLSAALPALLAGVVLTADPKQGFHALFSPVSPRRTDPGHLSFFFAWFGSKTSQATRTTSVLISPFIAIFFRSVRRKPAILGVLSLLLLLRPLFEPMSFSYYWMPPFLIAGLVGVAASGKVRVRDWVWQVFATLWSLPHGNASTTGTWWAVEAPLLCMIWIQVSFNCGLLRLPSRVHSGRNAYPPIPDLLPAQTRVDADTESAATSAPWSEWALAPGSSGPAHGR